jgi:succinoglycan biosynthesis transport protein ExoP
MLPSSVNRIVEYNGVPASDYRGGAAPADSDLGLSEIVRTILRRKWVLIGTIIPAMLIAVAIILQLTPLYTSETLILVATPQNNIAGLDAVAPTPWRDMETVQSEAYVLGSRALADRVISRLNLAEDPAFNPALRNGVEAVETESADEAAKLAAAQQGSSVVNLFLERLAVKPQEASRVISVSFTAEQPQMAAEVTNLIAEEYLLASRESKFESTKQTNSWLDMRIAELREDVEKAESAVEDWRRDSGLLAAKGVTLAAQELADVNAQLTMSRSTRAENEARLRQALELMESPGGANTASAVLDSLLIQRLREQESQVERRVAELGSEFGELHPKMIQLRAESRDLKERIETEVNKIIVGLQNEVAVSKAREKSLAQSLNSLKTRTAESNQKEVELRALEREAEANRLLLGTLLARQKETLSQEDFDFQLADARIISQAGVPVSPSYPPKAMILGLVFLSSGFLGLLIILVLELLDDGFRSCEQLEEATGLPSLGFVPETSELRHRGDLSNYLSERPNSAFGEAIRTLNWSLALAFPDAPPKTVLITSSHPDEGKSSIAITLAMTQALAGRRVLLIDADMRKPAVHSYLDLPPGPGLIDILSDNAEIDQVITTHEATGLSVITAGGLTRNAPNLLGSRRMGSVLKDLSWRYDLIIIDSPPVLVGSDVRILSEKVDATVVAVRWAATRRVVVNRVLKQLQTAAGRIPLPVLSMVNAKKHAQYGYGDSGAFAGDLEKYYAG